MGPGQHPVDGLLPPLDGGPPGSTGLAVLDFNAAINPPWVFNEHTVCVLSPPSNRLRLTVTAGEKRADH